MPNEPPTRTPDRHGLRGDPVPYAVLFAYGIFSLPYFFPVLPVGLYESYVRSIFPALSNIVALAVVIWGVRRLEDPVERRFWTFPAAALGALIVANGALELSYAYPDSLFWGLWTDVCYLAFYLFLVLAAQVAPHRPASARQRFTWPELTAVATAGIVLLAYFVVLPLSHNLGEYRTWLPSMYLYMALDLALVLLFLRLTVDARRIPRWRLIYGLFAAAVLIWQVLDLVESLQYMGVVEGFKGSLSDLAWNLPLVALVLAARVRHLGSRAPGDTDQTGVEEIRPLTSVALLATIGLPSLHLGFEALGLLNPDLRETRLVLILGAVMILGGLAFLERREVQARRWAERRQRKEAENALRESEARYRALVENAPDAIVVFDADTGKFVDSNDRALALYGVTRDELVECGPVDFSPPRQPDGRSSAEAAQAIVERALGGEIVNFEWTHHDASGRELLCDVCVAPQPAKGRRLVRGSLVDITEQVSLRERLREAQRMESIGRLAGGIAHDFNNLLTVITGYSDLMLGSRELPKNLRGELEQIRIAGERAASLTGQLLAFSRRQVMQLRPVDLNATVRGMQGMLRRLIGEDLDLVVRLDAGLGRILADPGQVEQVILNLAANARDAMPSGGVLTLETCRVSTLGDGQRPIDDGNAGIYGRLSVLDTGCGMDAETRSKIFEPFFTTKNLGRGTGLGLATVYGIVMQSGGYLTVESAPGAGSRFEVHFPVAPAAEAANEPAEPTAATPRGSETVLLVEDESAVRQMASSGLRELGYTVHAAADGEEALRVAARLDAPIDVVVSDVVLPGASGPEVVERIRELRPGALAILMSGYTDDLIARKGALDGEVPFLQKPFTAGRLASKIRETLDRAGVASPPSPWSGDSKSAN